MISDSLILAVNKPKGWTSFDVVNKLRRALRWKSVGHAGTLDPMATGVLILLFGDATKRTEEFMDLPKEYRACVRFGVETTSDDLDGEVTASSPVEDWSVDRIAKALQSFVGDIEQVPPNVSAIKIGGTRSYALAKSGVDVELPARRVTVHEARLLADREPEIELLVKCSRGTYVRSIARDLGKMLGWGGTLAALSRTAIGPYRIENSLTIEEIVNRTAEFRFR